MYRKCQCLPKWQVNHETISPQQTMARGQRDSFRSWTELQISIYFWCREVFQEVCVCVCVFWEVYVCEGGGFGWAVGRSEERGAWGLPRSCYLGCSSTAGGEREASGGNQVKGWRDWCTTPFSFLPNFHSRFFLFCFASFNRVSKREGEGYRERVKEKIKPIFLKTRSWLSYKQMLPVIWLLSRHIDRTILRVYWLAFSYLWFYYKENRSLTNMGIIFSQSVVFFV